jgi:broad specificity phosphatase PhoE
MPTILTLVRHGQTRANVEGVWHGSIDTPLTDLGREQAQRVAAHAGERFADARRIYASPLARAHDTARAIASRLSLSISVDADLSEFGLGDWEGRLYSDLHRVEKMWHRMGEDPDFAPPGGESTRQVATRMVAALRRIEQEARGERAIVVSHGGALTLALALLLDGTPNGWSRVVDNCSVSELVLEPEPELLSFNATSHLGDAAEGRGAGNTIVSQLLGGKHRGPRGSRV